MLRVRFYLCEPEEAVPGCANFMTLQHDRFQAFWFVDSNIGG